MAQLSAAYANNGGSCVAFIDESYVTRDFATTGGQTLYIMTAYVVPVDDIETMRADLIDDVVGGTYWHSTEANQEDGGEVRIQGFADYIGNGTEKIIVCIKRPIEADDSNGEKARAATFQELLRVLAEGSHCDPVKLVIFEERKEMTQRNIDARTVKAAQGIQAVRGMHILPMSPSFEQLLWLADMASFALYQRYAKSRVAYSEPFYARVIEIHA